MAGLLGGARPLPRRGPERKPKYYVLDMFPYPSAAGPPRRPPRGLHRDRHRRALQADARLQRAAPDGLRRLRPARRATTRSRPASTRRRSTAREHRQHAPADQALGFSYDWSREVNTTDPDYYKWTQWIFLQLFKRGLAYEDEVPINWCPSCKTGARQRGGHERPLRALRRPGRRAGPAPVDAPDHALRRAPARRPRRARLARADQEDAGELDRPLRGRRGRLRDRRSAAGVEPTIRIFTTRPDTLFGATYMVLAPEHPLVDEASRRPSSAPRSRPT